MAEQECLRIRHIAFASDHPGKAADFYKKAFGFRELRRFGIERFCPLLRLEVPALAAEAVAVVAERGSAVGQRVVQRLQHRRVQPRRPARAKPMR